MKEQIQSPITVVICILIAAYLGGFFWVRANCIHGFFGTDKTYYFVGPYATWYILERLYRPVFWVDEKLFGEKFRPINT